MSEPIDIRTLRAAALTTEELQRRVLAEMRELNDSGAGMWLELHPAAAFAVVAFCQLALRHPEAAQYETAANVKRFIEYVRGKFEPHAPAIAEAIRRGNDPQHDTPRDRYLETAPNTKGRDWVRERFEAEPEPAEDPRGLMEFILAHKTPPTPEEILAFLDSRRDPAPAVLTCPYCGHSERAMFEKVDVYICAKCGRTVETA